VCGADSAGDGTLLVSQAESIVKLLAKSAGLLELPKEEPGPLLPPKINIMFGRPDGRHNGQEFAERDRSGWEERESRGPEAEEGGAVSRATGPQNMPELDELVPEAGNVDTAEEHPGPEWEQVEDEGYYGGPPPMMVWRRRQAPSKSGED
jgi:hypothetical protein